MQRLNIQKGHAFILVYSVTSRQSLEELKPIYKDIVEIKGVNNLSTVPMMLAGNKCDETSNRDVATNIGERLAQEWRCAYMEVIIILMNFNNFVIINFNFKYNL